MKIQFCPLLLALSILVAGCSTQVAGMQAPVQHDYDVVDWLPLETEIKQPFIITSGYTAAVQNDPDTTPVQLLERIQELPEDTAGGALTELRIGVRPAAGEQPSPESMVSIFQADAEQVMSATARDLENVIEEASGQQPVDQRRLIDLRSENDWLIVDDLPEMPAGSIGLIELSPGMDRSGWEVGSTRWRAPYGGWPATGNESLSGAILFKTIYDQQVDATGLVVTGLDEAWGGLRNDWMFALVWIMALIVAVAGAAVLLTVRSKGATV